MALLAACAGSSTMSSRPVRHEAVTTDRLVSVIDDLDAYLSMVSTPHWAASSDSIWLIVPDAASGEPFAWHIETSSRRATRVQRAVQVKPAPDGRHIAFVGADGAVLIATGPGAESRQIAVVPTTTSRAGNERRPQLYWSPDSKRLAYAIAPAEIRVLNASSGEQRTVYTASDPSEIIEVLAWMPDSQRLVFAVDLPKQIKVEVRLVDPAARAGERMRVLHDSTCCGSYLNPSPAPNGSAIAFAQDPLGKITTMATHAAVVDPDSGATTRLTGADLWTNFQGGFQWAPDSTAFYTTCKRGAFNNRVCRIGVDGSIRTIALSPHQAVAITYEQGEKWSLSPDGAKLAWVSADAAGGLSLRTANVDGSSEVELMNLTPPMLRNFKVGAVEEVRWRSFDGLEIAGILVLPIAYERGQRYPLVVDLHGGPYGSVGLAGSLLAATAMEWHLWANQGYAVFYPEFRSTAIYGFDKLLAIREQHELFAQDYRDVMTGVDALIARGIADPDRLAVLGHSFGAGIANWILTHTDRFDLVVSYEGATVADLARVYHWARGGTMLPGRATALFTDLWDWVFGGSPEQVPQSYAEQSSITHASRAGSRVLVVAGSESDGKAHAEGSFARRWVDALRPHAREVIYLEYPGEGHAFVKPETRRDFVNRVAAELQRAFASVRDCPYGHCPTRQ